MVDERQYDSVIQVRCDQELKRRVRVEAAKQDMSLSQWVRELLRSETSEVVEADAD